MTLLVGMAAGLVVLLFCDVLSGFGVHQALGEKLSPVRLQEARFRSHFIAFVSGVCRIMGNTATTAVIRQLRRYGPTVILPAVDVPRFLLHGCLRRWYVTCLQRACPGACYLQSCSLGVRLPIMSSSWFCCILQTTNIGSPPIASSLPQSRRQLVFGARQGGTTEKAVG